MCDAIAMETGGVGLHRGNWTPFVSLNHSSNSIFSAEFIPTYRIVIQGHFILPNAISISGLAPFYSLTPHMHPLTHSPHCCPGHSMWSIWMLTIPSLRAKECMPREKDALNLLFVVMPLMNILLPFFWKSFPFIFTCDTALVLGIYWYKGVWKEVYGLPFEGPGAALPLPAAAAPAEQTEGSNKTPSSH